MSAAPVAAAVREHPIIFTGESVRAILDGRKTQTRRVIGTLAQHGMTLILLGVDHERQDIEAARCRYGVPGDYLWVRETWKENIPPSGWIYRADGALDSRDVRPWRSSMFMPRRASRLTLEVTEVRVQRLQDITEEDAIAEGFPGVHNADRDLDAVDQFHRGWTSINGKRAPWASNPWVWAITFRRAA